MIFQNLKRFSSFKLHFQKIQALSDPSHRPNIVILHGILGYGKMYKHLATNPSLIKNFNTYIVDFRDHGESPWTNSFTIEDMAEDIKNWIRSQDFHKEVHMICHSMGARVFVEISNMYPGLQNIINKSILVDAGSHSYKGYSMIKRTAEFMELLLKIDFNQSQEQIKAFLKSICSNDVQYTMLLLNLDIPNKRFKFNLRNISLNYMNISDYHFEEETKWNNDIYVLKALKSNYINDESKKIFRKMYKNIKDIVDVDSYHNIHLEKPYEIIKLLYKI